MCNAIDASHLLPALLREHLHEPARTEVVALLVEDGVLDHDPDDPLTVAGAAFRRRLDAEAWPRGLPWERPRRPGQLDFWRIHCFALDQLDELLGILLPDGVPGETSAGTLAWIGRHPDRPETVAVCLFTGRWDEPGTGQGGGDLISLIAYLGGLGQGQAARWLADWAGIAERRHA